MRKDPYSKFDLYILLKIEGLQSKKKGLVYMREWWNGRHQGLSTLIKGREH